MTVRKPAVAGTFYNGSREKLLQQIQGLGPESRDERTAVGIMAPHAGYVYSGAIAAHVLSCVEIPGTIVILSPNHTGMGRPVSIWPDGAWQTPLGDVPVETELIEILLEFDSMFEKDYDAHAREHSIEVQLPLLQYMRNDVHIVPITISSHSPDKLIALGTSLSGAIRRFNKPVLVLASTDMTHFEDARSAEEKDRLALNRIQEMDPEGLIQTVRENRISMCGYAPTAIMLQYANESGAANVEITGYTHSGEVSGDFNSVVGYAGAIIY